MPNYDVVDPEQISLCNAHSEGTEPLFDRIAASGAIPALATFSIGSVILVQRNCFNSGHPANAAIIIGAAIRAAPLHPQLLFPHLISRLSADVPALTM